ncbi:MAG: hypothetical protein SCARUB_01767 [Candidatus Scalindua rubra]|uniref:Uncharacterized protein n=1 Tax=Candidatus Scalindua rubra TaxID=1872076 RepID=A0A1E3XBT6_9BACT|nr:MAG: hypothetical protein SCARUB_01767 [Candidatus Scalindua rubra]
MTENEIGKVVAGLYSLHEEHLSACGHAQAGKGKNYYFLFYFFKFRFLSDLCACPVGRNDCTGGLCVRTSFFLSPTYPSGRRGR